MGNINRCRTRQWIGARAWLIKTVTLVRLFWSSKVRASLPKRQRFNVISQTSFQISSIFYIVLAVISMKHLPHDISERLGLNTPRTRRKAITILNLGFSQSASWGKVYLLSAASVTNYPKPSGFKQTNNYYLTVPWIRSSIQISLGWEQDVIRVYPFIGTLERI